MEILILGPQGSGKGTQAKRVASEYGFAHIATGDILRAAVAAGTELGRRVQPILEAGELVPDELMIELIRGRLDEPDAAEGFVLDGFPRTLVQAEALDAMLAEIDRPLAVVFEFLIGDDVCIQRLLTRASLEGRTDDTPDAIAKRLALYHELTAPVVEHYRTTGNLVGIHADRTEDEVFVELQAALERAGVS
jgi:adenylate kinase